MRTQTPTRIPTGIQLHPLQQGSLRTLQEEPLHPSLRRSPSASWRLNILDTASSIGEDEAIFSIIDTAASSDELTSLILLLLLFLHLAKADGTSIRTTIAAAATTTNYNAAAFSRSDESPSSVGTPLFEMIRVSFRQGCLS
ncbi:hypothetical protein F8388_016790 [Cannabis sativa]|uniref:Uncharacterized protein n=1 Tax=Cannabis sativa TaxID=3483 RepID=A0A7J6ERG8_CANSA|nr:hypothetical protein F8388_016790 [Cannabis sativa]